MYTDALVLLGEILLALVDTTVQLIIHLSGPRSNISGGKKKKNPANVRFCLRSSGVAQYCGEDGGEPLATRFSCTVTVVLGQRALAALKCAEHQTTTNGTKMWSTKTQREGCLCNQSVCLNHHMIEG